MNFYNSELSRIRRIYYANDRQIDTVIKTRHYIEENMDGVIDLDRLSTVRFTSKYHLLRLFKKYYGRTPKQYLTDVRIKKSKELLKSGMAVSQVCFSVGYESPSSFSTLFKNKMGLSPIQYQKEQLSRSQFGVDF